MIEITRFRVDMDGEMQPYEDGKWVRYEDTLQRTWVGLTDEEIKTICVENGWDSSWQSMRFAHAIEAKLKEKNNG